MNVEGVIFADDNVALMKKKDFIDLHMNVAFLDREEEDRRNMLSDIYDKIKGVKKPSGKEEGE
jgi:hypothetical protein